MTNTQRLIQTLEQAEQFGIPSVEFAVGAYTGNGPSVVAALRRRGFTVVRVPEAGLTAYRLERNPDPRIGG